eukprot:TRINITY_DN9407_c0_g1_i1.p1 TRINITY_DN9407_c0_g1~~TRINITY_DN9407_c0_g1_i1.p1  ORF type:complete len:177 (-),score=14.39 TRINITY_DN9407_c0_g1_i1:51-581(-)
MNLRNSFLLLLMLLLHCTANNCSEHRDTCTSCVRERHCTWCADTGGCIERYLCVTPSDEICPVSESALIMIVLLTLFLCVVVPSLVLCVLTVCHLRGARIKFDAMWVVLIYALLFGAPFAIISFVIGREDHIFILFVVLMSVEGGLVLLLALVLYCALVAFNFTGLQPKRRNTNQR